MEINNFREAFERGDDPTADMTDASDINSVAGVLKLYLRYLSVIPFFKIMLILTCALRRELRDPVFSVQYFDQFMELARE